MFIWGKMVDCRDLDFFFFLDLFSGTFLTFWGKVFIEFLTLVCIFLTTWRFWLTSSSMSQILPWCSTGSVTLVHCCSFRRDQRSAGPPSPLCRDTHTLYSPLLSFSLTARKHTTHTSMGCGVRVHSTCGKKKMDIDKDGKKNSMWVDDV